MLFLQSLHFGIRTGSGLSRGNMTSSLPPPSYFFPCSRSSSLCPSLPQPVPTHLQPHFCLQIPCWLSHVPAVRVCVYVCVCVWVHLNILVTSCVNKYTLTTGFQTMLKVCSGPYRTPSLPLSWLPACCVSEPLWLKAKAKVKLCWVMEISPRSDGSGRRASDYIRWNKSLRLGSRPSVSTALLIRSLNNLRSHSVRGILIVFQEIKRKHVWIWFSPTFLLLRHFTLFPPAFQQVFFFFPSLPHIPTWGSRPPSLMCTDSNARRHPRWENNETAFFSRRQRLYFSTAEQKNRTKTKAERTLPSFHGLPPSCLPLKGCCLYLSPHSFPLRVFCSDTSSATTKLTNRCDCTVRLVKMTNAAAAVQLQWFLMWAHHMTHKHTIHVRSINMPVEYSVGKRKCSWSSPGPGPGRGPGPGGRSRVLLLRTKIKNLGSYWRQLRPHVNNRRLRFTNKSESRQ